MADVFVSHAPEDDDRIARLGKCLAAEGHALTGQLNAADAIIVLWSPRSVPSARVREDARHALEGGKLIQASLDGTMPPLPFNMIHAIPLDGWGGEPDHPGWRKIVTSLAAIGVDDDGPRAVAEPRAAASAAPDRTPRIGAAVAITVLAVGALAGLSLLVFALAGVLGPANG